MKKLFGLKKISALLLLAVLLIAAWTVPSFAGMSVTDVGSNWMLAAYVNTGFSNSSAKDLVLHLYCTNVTPTDTMTPASFTECTGGNYAPITLTNGSWTCTTGTPSSCSYAAQTFTFSGALTTNGTIYGYYITDKAPTPNEIAAELFGSTFTPANSGDNEVVTPKISLSEGTPN